MPGILQNALIVTDMKSQVSFGIATGELVHAILQQFRGLFA